MKNEFVPPRYGEEGFNCPVCSAFAQQDWQEALYNRPEDEYFLSNELRQPNVAPIAFSNSIGENGYSTNNLYATSKCYKCDGVAFWLNGNLVYPPAFTAPLPNPDMPEDVKEIYIEARSINSLSPIASAALLRLALEKLLPQIGAKKAGIDKMIGDLVGRGLPKEVEKALDSLRVIGNEAVHPGTIDLKDNIKIATALFKLLNVVVDRMITQQREIDEIYSLIPESKLKGIEERNNKALNN